MGTCALIGVSTLDVLNLQTSIADGRDSHSNSILVTNKGYVLN